MNVRQVLNKGDQVRKYFAQALSIACNIPLNELPKPNLKGEVI